MAAARTRSRCVSSLPTRSGLIGPGGGGGGRGGRGGGGLGLGLGGWAALAAVCIATSRTNTGVQDRALISLKQSATGTAEIQQAYECYSGAVRVTK